MDIIENSSLPACYRLYYHEGIYVRVKIIPKEGEDGVYLMSAQVATETGDELGSESLPSPLNCAAADATLPVFSQSKATAKKGELVRADGRIFAHNGTDVIDHGPLPANANDAVAELMVTFDRAARPMVEQASRTWFRQSAGGDINKIIGVI